jgi:hypothetical protein
MGVRRNMGVPSAALRSAVPHLRWRFKILGAQIVRLRVSASAVETAFAGAPLPNADGKKWEVFIPFLQHQSIKFFVDFIC